jgi:hypothetical protein
MRRSEKRSVGCWYEMTLFEEIFIIMIIKKDHLSRWLSLGRWDVAEVAEP